MNGSCLVCILRFSATNYLPCIHFVVLGVPLVTSQVERSRNPRCSNRSAMAVDADFG
jgi:hypothetical protein